MRNAAVEAFKAGTVPILVCTDVAARGLDIKDVSHGPTAAIPMENPGCGCKLTRCSVALPANR